MHNLVSLADLSARDIHALFDRAESLAANPAPALSLAGRTIANIFLEPSTRTRVSFELAARRLGADVVSLDMGNSSFSKGESISDTYRTLRAMGINGFVLRTAEVGLPAQLKEQLGESAAVFNAGEANVAHPTQGLLDALTIRQHKPQIDTLSVAVVGDVAHSRVARSTLRVLDILGCQDMRIVAPAPWQPVAHEMPKAIITDNLKLGIQGCDVVIALRIQRERLGSGERLSPFAYTERYRIDSSSLREAKSNAIVMHPGPMNRGIEISDEVADGPQSVILQQVANGVSIRTAVFDTVARTRGWYLPQDQTWA